MSFLRVLTEQNLCSFFEMTFYALQQNLTANFLRVPFLCQFLHFRFSIAATPTFLLLFSVQRPSIILTFIQRNEILTNF
jgi:hypothetical protein